MCTSKSNDENKKQDGITITDTDGTQYYIFGKSRIKAIPHNANLLFLKIGVLANGRQTVFPVPQNSRRRFHSR